MNTTIVIPTYNERVNIKDLIPSIFTILPGIRISVVDDNSPDGTQDEVGRLAKIYKNISLIKREKKEGLGKAYTHAFKMLLRDTNIHTIVMMDADFSHDPSYLPQLLKLRNEADVVIGSRYIRHGNTEGWELWRKFLSKGGNLYCRRITGMPINDCTGGFNAISTNQLRKIDMNSLDSSGYAFIMELKYRLHKVGSKFAEVPIIFKNRREGESKISSHIIKEGIIAPWKMRFKRAI
jgi:dolichol-phosphate mannosyltransferase